MSILLVSTWIPASHLAYPVTHIEYQKKLWKQGSDTVQKRSVRAKTLEAPQKRVDQKERVLEKVNSAEYGHKVRNTRSTKSSHSAYGYGPSSERINKNLWP